MPNSALTGRRTLRAGATLVLLALLSPAAAHAEPAGDELNRRIKHQSDQLEIVVEHYHELREDLRITSAQTVVLKRQIEPLRVQITQRRAAVGKLAAAGYRSQRASAVNLLLDAANSGEAVRRLLMLQTFAQRQQREIDALTLTSERYVSASRTLNALYAQQREQQKLLVAQRVSIENSITELKALRTRAYGAGGRSTRISRSSGRTGIVLPKLTGAGEKILDFALDQVGKSYKWAGEGPGGFDCSGLVMAAFDTVGVKLPHQSGRQQQQSRQIRRAELRPGDLIFFYQDSHHVGIYLGGGKMVHAPQYGEQVRIDGIDELPINGFGRVIDAATAIVTKPPARRPAAEPKTEPRTEPKAEPKTEPKPEPASTLPAEEPRSAIGELPGPLPPRLPEPAALPAAG